MKFMTSSLHPFPHIENDDHSKLPKYAFTILPRSTLT